MESCNERKDPDMPTGSTYAAIEATNEVFTWLSDLRERLVSGERPIEVSGPLGIHSVYYIEAYDHSNEEGEAYAIVACCLPDGVFAEIGDGTYGTLEGFRIFLGTC
jgi:hypothetical protein